MKVWDFKALIEKKTFLNPGIQCTKGTSFYEQNHQITTQFIQKSKLRNKRKTRKITRNTSKEGICNKFQSKAKVTEQSQGK